MTHTSSNGLHDWPCLAFTYRIVASPSAPLLEVSIALDSSRLPDNLDARASVQADYASLAAWFAPFGEDTGTPVVSIDTGGALTSGPSSQAPNGRDLAEALAAFTAEAAGWLDSPTGDAPGTTLTISTSPGRPIEWPSDLHALNVTVSISSEWESIDTVVPPARDLAAALESAFDNYNGADSALKLAFRDGIETWLCRWGAGGTSIGIRQSEQQVFWALPPFSHVPLSATVDGRTFQDVDLRRWVSEVLHAVQSLATRVDAARPARARLAAAVARTLVPLFRTPGDFPNTTAAADAVAVHLARDLTMPIACVMQLPASVQSSVGSDARPAPSWRIHGDVIDASRDATTRRLNTDGVPLAAGDPTIEILVGVDDLEGRDSAALDLSFRATGLASADTSLRFAIPVVVPVGIATCPLPLTALPAPPHIARATGTQDEPDSIPDYATLWAFTVSIPDAFAVHDALTIEVRLNPQSTDVAVTPTAPDARVTPLFEAVARFLIEWAGEPAVDRALALAANVSAALETWSPAPAVAQAPAHDDQGVWRYRCEWNRDTGVLTLHAEPSGSGSPVWPAIEGYTQDAVESGALPAIYRRQRADVPHELSLTWNRMAARGIRQIAAGMRVDRNLRVAPVGARLHPAFLLSSATVGTPVVERPPLGVDSPVVLPPAASLSALFKDVVAIPRGAHMTEHPPGVEASIAINYSFVISGDIRSSIPVLQAQIPLTGEHADEAVRTLAAHVDAWRTSVPPRGTDPQFTVSLALFFLEPEAGPQPAVRINEVIIPDHGVMLSRS